MFARQEEAQTGGFFRNSRVDDGQGVDASLQQALSKLRRNYGIAGDHGDHREALARPDIEPGGPSGFEEELPAGLQARDSLRLAEHDLDGGQSGGGKRGRHANAEDEAWRSILEILHEIGTAGDVASAGGESFAQRSHPEVDVCWVDAALLCDPTSALAEYADGMRFVHQQDGVVTPLDVDEGSKVREVPVHGVDAFEQYEDTLVTAPLVLQDPLGCFMIVVRKGKPTSAGKGSPLNR